MRGTVPRKISALALVAALLVSTFAAPAAAGASSVAWGATNYDVDETVETTVGFDVSTDSTGLNETVEVDVVDPSTGSVVTTFGKSVDIAANSTDTVTFAFTPEAQGIAPGTYDLVAHVNGSTYTSELSVNEVADQSVTIEQNSYEITSNDTETVVNATLSAGGQDRVGPVEFVVLNDSGDVVHSETIENYTVTAGSTATESFTVSDSDVDAGNYTVEVVYAGVSDSGSLSVEDTSEPVIGGGVIDDASGDPLAVGGVVVVVILIALAVRAE